MANLGTIGKSVAVQAISVSTPTSVVSKSILSPAISLPGYFSDESVIIYKNIEGIVYKNGVVQSTEVFLFEKQTKNLLLTTTSNASGYFIFVGLPSNVDYFLTSFSLEDPNDFKYNAIIKDKIVMS